MSNRNVRKMFGQSDLPPPEDNSDEEYEPQCTKNAASNFGFQGLVLSSHSESENELVNDMSEEEVEVTHKNASKKKERKKKNKKSKSMATCSKENVELDEIDKSVMEVNALLGEPEKVQYCPANDTVVDPAQALFCLQPRYLNVDYELKKLFGADAVEKKRQTRTRFSKRAVIIPMKEDMHLVVSGLSMELDRRENGCMYFTYNHSREYQRIHREYLKHILYVDTENVILPVGDPTSVNHIEQHLENAAAMFSVEEQSLGNKLVEHIISYLQYVAHPSFVLTDMKIRLEYKVMENRPFHIALLMYIHLLSNRACHRTALELAKLLLNLDPSDPLAMLFIIDTLALRAREHQWLIEAIDLWSKERDASFLHNIKYSYALSHYHVATQKGDDLSHADKLLQDAMLRFPSVFAGICESASINISGTLKNSQLFRSPSEPRIVGRDLKVLIQLYTKFTSSKWREPGPWKWLIRNAEYLAEKYENSKEFQDYAQEMSYERSGLFPRWPEEVTRHLHVIRPLLNLLVDWTIPSLRRTRASDPVPPAVYINRYKYPVGPAPPEPSANSAIFMQLFSSIFNMAPDPPHQE